MAEGTKPAPCQVRSKTGNPCPRRAEVEILGVDFCEPCAREQAAYFAIGELTREEAQQAFRSEAPGVEFGIWFSTSMIFPERGAAHLRMGAPHVIYFAAYCDGLASNRFLQPAEQK